MKPKMSIKQVYSATFEHDGKYSGCHCTDEKRMRTSIKAIKNTGANFINISVIRTDPSDNVSWCLACDYFDDLK